MRSHLLASIVSTAAPAPLAFARRNLGYASDVNGVVYQLDNIVDHGLQIVDGYLLPPPGPGLEVTLDPARLEKYRMAT